MAKQNQGSDMLGRRLRVLAELTGKDTATLEMEAQAFARAANMSLTGAVQDLVWAAQAPDGPAGQRVLAVRARMTLEPPAGP